MLYEYTNVVSVSSHSSSFVNTLTVTLSIKGPGYYYYFGFRICYYYYYNNYCMAGKLQGIKLSQHPRIIFTIFTI